MVLYECVKCGKEYNSKGDYRRHLNRKTSCMRISDYDRVKKKLDQLKDKLFLDYLEENGYKKEEKEEIKMPTLEGIILEIMKEIKS